MSDAPHIPVMLNEVVQYMSPKDGEVYVDGTLGAGGYTRALLDAADCKVIAVDRDHCAIDAMQDDVERYNGRLTLVHGAFGDVAEHLDGLGIERVDGLVIDIGVSSMQIDQADRGFSFRFDGPLDMRMDTSQGETAADIVNTRKEENLANIIYEYGEERLSRRIAKVIINNRPFTTTATLADAVRSVVPRSGKNGIDPATRTFQALRIAVNDELGELKRFLGASHKILNSDGRLVVVSFHSLEDRIVKNFLRGEKSKASRHDPVQDMKQNQNGSNEFELLSRKAVNATDAELKINPRSRSARLRAAKKVGG